jgi:hypothetical protein
MKPPMLARNECVRLYSMLQLLRHDWTVIQMVANVADNRRLIASASNSSGANSIPTMRQDLSAISIPYFVHYFTYVFGLDKARLLGC